MTDLRIVEACEAGVTNTEICDFYARHWARPIALTREDFCNWQMNAAPGAGGHNHSVLALEGDRIIAVMGATPSRFRLLNKSCMGAELTTWVVAPEARGKGVGGRILDYLQQRHAVLTGAGITGAALPLYLGAGFTYLAHMPRFFHIADFDLAQRFAPVTASARRVTMRRQTQSATPGWQARAVSAADLAPAAGALRRYGHFARDAARLAWRHDHHAAFRYEAFAVSDPARPDTFAGVILRADVVEETPILHVIDLFGPPAHLPAALAFVEDQARLRGAAFADISLTAGPVIAQIRARGWSSAVDDALIELPSLFYPVELRRPPTTSLVIWSRADRDRMFDIGRLHITRADMDLDRPTLSWYERHPI